MPGLDNSMCCFLVAVRPAIYNRVYAMTGKYTPEAESATCVAAGASGPRLMPLAFTASLLISKWLALNRDYSRNAQTIETKCLLNMNSL